MKSSPRHSTQDLIAALRALRLLIREVGNNYLAGMQSEVAHIEQVIREGQAASGKLPNERAKGLRRIRRDLGRLDIKPDKGRRRDLKQIEKVISDIMEVVDGW
jgi:hypothetical protein